MKQGGKIRIATPGLELLFKVFSADKSNKLVKRLLAERGQPWSNRLKDPLPVFFINKLFYGHGHRFIWDFKSLKAALESAGFRKVVRCEPGHSTDKNLNRIEWRELESKRRRGFNKLETIVVEATK